MRIFYPDPNCFFLVICTKFPERKLENESEDNTPLPAYRMRISHPDPNCSFLIIDSKFPERHREGEREG